MSRAPWPGARRGLPALAALLAALAPAQPALAQLERSGDDVSATEPPQRFSPLGRFGLARLSRGLDAEGLERRLRAMRRLGELGDPAALARLASHAVERRSRLVGREWLALAHALAGGAGDDEVRLVLAMLLNQAASPALGPEEAGLLELARGTAAMALAADGGQESLAVLGRALRAHGAIARAAAQALLAYPPRALAPLSRAGPPSSELAALLGALGDQRAFHMLRGWVRGAGDARAPAADVRAAAALALTRLGHLETVPLGARWLEAASPELAEAGLDILLAARDPRADEVLRERLGAERVADADQRRLLQASGPPLADAALASVARAAPGEAWRWALLGRVGGDAAAQRLVQALGEPKAAFAAAHALSRLPGGAASAGLETALAGRVALPLSVRAAALRARWLGEPARGLAERARALVGAATPSERAAGAWVLALGGGAAAARELRSGDEARVLAAASLAYGFEGEALAALAGLLESAPPGRVRDAASACLGSAAGRERVSSGVLWALVADAGVARPLALRALLARDDPGIRAARGRWLSDSDPLLRAHAARGLGESADASAVGLLIARLDVEADESVRHAIVLALGAQGGRTASEWLARTARLEPSSRVRSAARLALAGVPLNDPPPGREALWLELRDASAGRAALLEIAPGLALPVLPDATGVVVAAGLPSPEVGIRLQ